MLENDFVFAEKTMKYQSTLKKIVTAAGELALRMQAEIDPERVDTKATEKDIVTKADRAVENFLRSELQRNWPGYAFYGEESCGDAPVQGAGPHAEGAPDQYTWVVDPIDGTLSYVMRQPFWCVSVGLWKNGRPVAGCVCAPVLRETYYAEAGAGAFCNDRPIHARRHGTLKDAVLSTGFSCIRSGWTQVNNLKYFSALSLTCRGVRRFGSAAMDINLVASGRLDGFWELNLHPYDIGAAWLVLSEAGGVISDLHGGQRFPEEGILAVSTPELQAEMLKYFRDYQRPAEAK